MDQNPISPLAELDAFHQSHLSSPEMRAAFGLLPLRVSQNNQKKLDTTGIKEEHIESLDAGSSLTPEMIAMFRFSEEFRREKLRTQEEADQKERDSLAEAQAQEDIDLSERNSVSRYTRLYGSKAQEIMSKERAWEERMSREGAQNALLWPILPITF